MVCAIPHARKIDLISVKFVRGVYTASHDVVVVVVLLGKTACGQALQIE